MRLCELIERARQEVRLASPSDPEVRAVVDDSRLAGPGVVFAARPGRANDGRRFIPDAVSRGAVGVLTNTPVDLPEEVALLLSDDPLDAAVGLAEVLHDYPGPKLQRIGITGTNGKTTTAFLVRHLLNAAGRRCGLLGTIETDTGNRPRPAALTTPGRLELTSLLAEMVDGGCDSVVMEVSSHALDQGRVDGLGFDVGVFTNLTGDHLDYHETMEAYAEAKARLMTMLPPEGTAIVNGDDPAHARMLEECEAGVLRFRVGEGGEQTAGECTATVLEATLGGAAGTHTVFAGPWGELEATLPLIGRHNVANMLAALAAVHAVGVDVRTLASAVASCPQVPGRLERVGLDEGDGAAGAVGGFEVLVDYAHTDDALENVLAALRPITPGRLRVLFGCGGDRDPAKRPRMARVACRLGDAIVVTSDNPRTEDPQKIIDDILTGVAAEDRPRVTVEPDRRAAIQRIIADADPGDVVLIAGKGHEDYQLVGEQRLDFDDRAEARQALAAAAATKEVEGG